MKKSIWGIENWSILYKQLVDKFGPFSSWETNTHPPDKDEFEEFCKGFANVIGAKSGRAVKQQIRWAITDQEYVSRTYMTTYFGNKVVAMNVGFITRDKLPLNTVCEYQH